MCREEAGNYFDKNLRLPPSKLLLLPLQSHDTVSFDTRVGMIKAPRIDVLISTLLKLLASETLICGYSLIFTYHTTTPTTARSEHQGPKSINTELIVLEIATRRRVALDIMDV